MSNSKQFLLDTIGGGKKQSPAKWWCIVIEQGEGGELIATQDGARVPNGSISRRDNVIFISERGANPGKLDDIKRKLYR